MAVKNVIKLTALSLNSELTIGEKLSFHATLLLAHSSLIVQSPLNLHTSEQYFLPVTIIPTYAYV